MLQMVLAQALVEHGLLDSLAAGILHARTHLELYIGQGNSTLFEEMHRPAPAGNR
jgi:hypothetical protein